MIALEDAVKGSSKKGRFPWSANAKQEPEISASKRLTIETSFVADSPPVKRMRQAFEKKGALVWYELLQNAYDYNDYSKGQPTVIIVFKDGTRKSLSELTRPPLSIAVDRVEIINHIQTVREGLSYKQRGLDPFEIGNIDHGGDDSTLGEHGWGGTNAAALLTADKHCRAILYRSVMQDGTPYVAVGGMTIRSEKQEKPRFTLEVALQPAEKLTETTITIDQPDQKILDLLLKVSDEFLYANPKYRGYGFAGAGEKREPVPNQFSMTGVSRDEPHATVFSDADMRMIFPNNIAFEKNGSGRQTLAVEILSPNIFANPKLKPPPVFTGGLRVEGIYINALPWNFMGFKRDQVIDHRFRADRSTDSRSLEGFPIRLMCLVLARCDNPDVHYTILKTILKDKCFEGEIDKYDFSNWLSPGAKVAIGVAYRRLLTEKKLSVEKTVAVDDAEIATRLKINKMPSIVLNPSAYIKALSYIGLTRSTSAVVKDQVEFSKTNERISLDDEPVATSELEQNLLAWAARWGGQANFSEDTLTLNLRDFRVSHSPNRLLEFTGKTIDVIRQLISLYGDVFEVELQAFGQKSSVEFGFSVDSINGMRHADVHRAQIDELPGKVGLELRLKLRSKKRPQDLAQLQSLRQLLASHTNAEGFITYSSAKELQKLVSRKTGLENRIRLLMIGKASPVKHSQTQYPAKFGERESNGEMGGMPESSELDWADAVDGAMNFWMRPIVVFRESMGVIPPVVYLLTHSGNDFNPSEYQADDSIKPGWRPYRRSIHYSEISTAQPLLLPPGYEPVSYRSKNGKQVFFRHSIRNAADWLVEANEPVKNVTVYLKKISAKESVEIPGANLVTTEVEAGNLRPELRNIIEAMNGNEKLTDSQKFAIIAKAVKRGFFFSANANINYATADGGGIDSTRVVNELRGTCGHMAEAVVILCRLANIPCESQSCYFAMLGRAASLDAHAIIRVYLDGKPRLYEPQAGKYLDGKGLVGIHQDFKRLIKSIPKGGSDLVTTLKFSLPYLPFILAGGTGVFGLIMSSMAYAPTVSLPVSQQTEAILRPVLDAIPHSAFSNLDMSQIVSRLMQEPEIFSMIAALLATFVAVKSIREKVVYQKQVNLLLKEVSDYLAHEEAVIENQDERDLYAG